LFDNYFKGDENALSSLNINSLNDSSKIKEELEMRTKNMGNEWLLAHLNFVRGPE